MKKSRKILAGFLAVSLLAAGVPVITAGQPDCFSIVASAVEGEGTEANPWKIGKDSPSSVTAYLTGNESNKTLHISGAGAMMDFSNSSRAPWTLAGGNDTYAYIRTIVIEPGVTSIGDYEFYYLIGVTSVTIPDSVTSIGNSAFASCNNLTNVTIPENVTSIGDLAFYYCNGLTSITIPDSVTSIGKNVFVGCTGLTSVTISERVTSIGEGTFAGCSSLTSINIPDSVTSIGDDAFTYCAHLTSVTIPKNVTRIDNGAFSNCSNLSTVTFECGTEGTNLEIGSNAFNATAANAQLAYGTGNTRLFDGDTEITEGSALTNIYRTEEAVIKTLKWKTPAAPAPAAVYTPVPASAPTCTESGNIAYYIGDDGKYYLDADGNTETTIANVTIPATGHDWGEWVTVKEPTYYETGLRQRICLNDPTHIETEEIPVKGIEYFTVSFNTAGGNYISSQTVQGGKIAARPADPTRNGYTFRYWTLNGSAYNFDRPVMENLTLTAVWEQNSVNAAGSSNALIPFMGRYGINYNLDGGTNSPENPSYYNRGEGTSLAPAYKAGYVFEGWYLDSNFTKPIYSISDIQSGKVILYAKFTPDSSVKPVVTAKVSENGDVELSWDSVNGAEKYKVYRYVNGKLRFIAFTENTSYTISGESGENTYAVKALKNGEWTEIYKSDLVTVTAE